MLTTCLLLGSWLKVSGTLPLVPLYAFVILTRTSPDYSQLRVLGLVVVFNVTVIRLSSRLLVVYVCFIRHLNFTKSLSLSFLWGKKKLFPADVSLSWCRLEISFCSVNILWTLMSHASIQRKKYGEYILTIFDIDIQLFIFGMITFYWCCTLRTSVWYKQWLLLWRLVQWLFIVFKRSIIDLAVRSRPSYSHY